MMLAPDQATAIQGLQNFEQWDVFDKLADVWQRGVEGP